MKNVLAPMAVITTTATLYPANGWSVKIATMKIGLWLQAQAEKDRAFDEQCALGCL
jgi:hypothetical protein